MNKIVNLRSAKYLVRRYEKFLKMEIPYSSFRYGLIRETGFYVKCMLCNSLKKQLGRVNCDHCIWSLAEIVLNLPSTGCGNDNYKALHEVKDYEEGKKLLTERIAMLKELIKKAESKNTPINPPKSH